MSKVIVLGTNLEGLLAGHAASIAGHEVYFIEQTDEPVGLDFLSAPIPMLQLEAKPLYVSGEGESGDFFGKLTDGLVTKHFDLPFTTVDAGAPIWNPGQAFLQLQEIYGAYFQAGDRDIDDEFVASLASDATIISSVQLPAICKEPDDHTFSWTGLVTMAGGADGTGRAEIKAIGDRDIPAAIIGGTFFGPKKIYPHGRFPPVSADKLQKSMLPLKTNCDCWPDMIKVGSAAAWNPGYRTHRAFYDVFEKLDV